MKNLRHLTLMHTLQPWLVRVATKQRYFCSIPIPPTGDGERSTSASMFKSKLATGPRFKDFIKDASPREKTPEVQDGHVKDTQSYLPDEPHIGNSRKMNVNDTEIAWSILQRKGYLRTSELSQADVILLVTCSVREKAEQTIWNRLQQLTYMKKRRSKVHGPLKIGVLGCTAERLKTELLEREKLKDHIRQLSDPERPRPWPRLFEIRWKSTSSGLSR